MNCPDDYFEPGRTTKWLVFAISLYAKNQFQNKVPPICVSESVNDFPIGGAIQNSSAFGI